MQADCGGIQIRIDVNWGDLQKKKKKKERLLGCKIFPLFENDTNRGIADDLSFFFFFEITPIFVYASGSVPLPRQSSLQSHRPAFDKKNVDIFENSSSNVPVFAIQNMVTLGITIFRHLKFCHFIKLHELQADIDLKVCNNYCFPL